MTFIVSHPTGNPNVRGLLSGLSAVGELAEFWTSVALPARLAHYLPTTTLRRRALQRNFPEVGDAKIIARPTLDLVRTALRLAKIQGPLTPETGWASTEAINAVIDSSLARRLQAAELGRVSGVYCYEDVARDSFRAAKERGLSRVYELPSAYWRTSRALLLEEAERHPDWACTMVGLRDSEGKRARKDEEIFLAQRIIVASSFTKNSLQAFDGTLPPIEVIPYGCPTPKALEPARRAGNEPLHIFYAGQIGQRKGFADLVTALEALDFPWRLTVAGSLPREVPAALQRFLARHEVSYIGAVPHAELMERLQRAHVFLFPSIVEGFGMVVTEAMACGLVAIASEHTCASDVIEDGRNGFVIPIRSPERIIETLQLCYEDEDLRTEMAREAIASVAMRSWDGYAARVAELVQEWV
jgi:starch synthase